MGIFDRTVSKLAVFWMDAGIGMDDESYGGYGDFDAENTSWDDASYAGGYPDSDVDSDGYGELNVGETPEEQQVVSAVVSFLSAVPVVGSVLDFINDVQQHGVFTAAANVFSNAIVSGMQDMVLSVTLGPTAAAAIGLANSIGLTDKVIDALPEDVKPVVQAVLNTPDLLNKAAAQGASLSVDKDTNNVELETPDGGPESDTSNDGLISSVASPTQPPLGGSSGPPSMAMAMDVTLQNGTPSMQPPAQPPPMSGALPGPFGLVPPGYDVHYTETNTGAPPQWAIPLWDEYMAAILGTDETKSYAEALSQAGQALAQKYADMDEYYKFTGAMLGDKINQMAAQKPVQVSFGGQQMGQFLPYTKSMAGYLDQFAGLMKQYEDLAAKEAQAQLLAPQGMADLFIKSTPFLQSVLPQQTWQYTPEQPAPVSAPYQQQPQVPEISVPDPSLAQEIAGWLGVAQGAANVLSSPAVSSGLSWAWDTLTGLFDGGDSAGNLVSDAGSFVGDAMSSVYDLGSSWLTGGGGSGGGLIDAATSWLYPDTDWLSTDLFSW
ncbi:MAG: hypothetical protein Q9M13_03390 [Mariprofundales bacterium]|nr:hypothetical protein [Mariprofundales bacterium]